jgi:molybdopterin molybdotransferase
MLNVDEALNLIAQHIAVLGSEVETLEKVLGRVAARDYFMPWAVPAWDSSARDGFALRSADIEAAGTDNPVHLKVIDTVVAGSTSRRQVTAGAAIRIMTGAPLPPGADCVVGFEDTVQNPGWPLGNHGDILEIVILHPLTSGQNVALAGHQVHQGELLVKAGMVIGPGPASLLASAGLSRIEVFRRPVVAIIATGTELVRPGRPLTGPRIYMGSSYSLAGQVRRCGGIPKLLGIARDTRTAIAAKLKRGMEADLVITTGGVAFGDRDLMKSVMAEMGEVIFSEIAMLPGKSTAFGLLRCPLPDAKIRLIPHFALSGNPPATGVGFEVLAGPAILKMAGRANPGPSTISARLMGKIANPANFRRFIWVTLDVKEGVIYAQPLGKESGGTLTGIARAAGLAIIPEKTSEVKEGRLIQVMVLNWV